MCCLVCLHHSIFDGLVDGSLLLRVCYPLSSLPDRSLAFYITSVCRLRASGSGSGSMSRCLASQLSYWRSQRAEAPVLTFAHRSPNVPVSRAIGEPPRVCDSLRR